MNFNKSLHWFVYVTFLFSCARQSSPTGGPKDTIPPVLEKAIPRDEAINFKGKQLELLFSEDVILNAPKEQLIVTPTIGKEYKITARKNTVVITFDQTLEDSTTYTFNFRESVQDITEKNPVRNLQVAFSTGNYIDSLSVEGTVYDLLRGKEIKEATVALHAENDTFNIFKHPAVFFTKTDEHGKFKISHLKPYNFFLYGFEDKNRNLVVDTRTESYGFLAEYLYLIEDVKNTSLGLIRLDARPLKMTSARPYNTYFNIRTAKNLRTFELSAADSSDLSYTFGEDNANIRLYNTIHQDSIQIHLVATDSIDNKIDTTLYAKFLTREVTPEKFTVSIQSSSILAHRGQFEATITFSKPLKEINFDSVYYKIDSLKQINFTRQDVSWDPLSRKLSIRKKVDKNLFISEQNNTNQAGNNGVPPAVRKSNTGANGKEGLKKSVLNEFYLGTAAFMSVESDSSKKITQNIKPLKEDELSVINIQVKTKEKYFMVELLDNTFKVIKTRKNEPKVRFEDINPGEYQIRLIIDRNKNGRWDPGNYLTKTEPEPIIYYRTADGSTTIKGVKANWEIGEGEMFITY